MLRRSTETKRALVTHPLKTVTPSFGRPASVSARTGSLKEISLRFQDLNAPECKGLKAFVKNGGLDRFRTQNPLIKVVMKETSRSAPHAIVINEAGRQHTKCWLINLSEADIVRLFAQLRVEYTSMDKGKSKR